MVEKSLLRQIWRLSFPVLLANLLQTSVNIVDTVMIGRLGPISIAAIGMANTVHLLLLITVLAISGGAMSLIAQAKGSRDPLRLSFVTRQALVTSLLLSSVLLVAGVALAEPLLRLIDSSGETEAIRQGADYLIVIFLGSPFLVLNVVVNRLMQGAGDTVTPLVLTGSISVLNIFFNYLFIFGWGPIPALGIAGAAIGAILARALAVGVAIYIFYSGTNVIKILPGSWLPHWQLVKDILSIGVPSGIQGFLRHVANLLVMGFITATELGAYGAAVLAIGTQAEIFAIQAVVGMNVAATSLVGQELGKWQPEEAFRKGNLITYLGVIVMIILVVPMILFAPQIIRLFDPSAHPVVMEGSLTLFRTILLALPFTAVAIMATGTLRGAGDTKPAMMSTLLCRNLLTIGLAWLLAFPFKLGAMGIWYGIIIGRVLDGVYMWVVWRARKWQKVALRKTDLYRQHLRHLAEPVREEYLREVRTPLMAIAGAVEQVYEHEVIYIHPNGERRVRFEAGDFRRLS